MWLPDVITSTPCANSASAVDGVRPIPPARFSPLAVTKSIERSSRSAGISASTASLPGLPMTSPTMSTRHAPGGRGAPPLAGLPSRTRPATRELGWSVGMPRETSIGSRRNGGVALQRAVKGETDTLPQPGVGLSDPSPVSRRPAFVFIPGLRRIIAIVLALGLVLTAAGTAAAMPPTRGDSSSAAAKPVGGGGGKPARGFDISYPQCGAPYPANPLFGIVGVNAGRPYVAGNPCLATQITWGGGEKAELYVNTANPDPALSGYWPTGKTSPRFCD